MYRVYLHVQCVQGLHVEDVPTAVVRSGDMDPPVRHGVVADLISSLCI